MKTGLCAHLKIRARLLLPIVILFSAYQGAAQATYSGSTSFSSNYLYYSAQTGQADSVSGTLTITTSPCPDSIHCDYSSATLSSSGPIIYNVSAPLSLSGTGGSTRTWNGSITVNTGSAPAPGYSVQCTLTGHYDIHYSMPGAGPGNWNVGSIVAPQYHHWVEDTGSETDTIIVYSIRDSVSGPGCVQYGDSGVYSVTTFPASGGSVLWSTGATTASITKFIYSDQVISATFTIGGVSYTDSISVHVCCNGVHYNPSTHRCSSCGGSLHVVPISKTGCCNGVDYDTTVKGCCNGQLYDLTTHRCSSCGDSAHVTSIYKTGCCGGVDYDTSSKGCCNGHLYDLSTHGCCNNVIYNLSTHRCSNCGGTLHLVPINKTGCCAGIDFDPSLYNCVGGVLVPK